MKFQITAHFEADSRAEAMEVLEELYKERQEFNYMYLDVEDAMPIWKRLGSMGESSSS